MVCSSSVFLPFPSPLLSSTHPPNHPPSFFFSFFFIFSFSSSSSSFFFFFFTFIFFLSFEYKFNLYTFLLSALSKLLNSLRENKSEIPSCTEEEFGFLSELLQSKELNALVTVHNKILNNVKDDKFFPVLSNSMDIDIEVLDLLSTKTHVSEEYKELFHLLQKPHMQVRDIVFVIVKR